MIGNHSVLAICIGGLIGYAASRRNGFSPIAGVACGLLMGPILAWVLFTIDGIFHANEGRRCPHCCEWANPEASVCGHCGNRMTINLIMPPSKPGPPRLVWSRRD